MWNADIFFYPFLELIDFISACGSIETFVPFKAKLTEEEAEEAAEEAEACPQAALPQISWRKRMKKVN